MKYYAPRPIAGYIFLSILATGLVGALVSEDDFGGYEITTAKRALILAAIFGLCLLFFFLRAVYKRNRRYYVELAQGYIEWISYEGKKEKRKRINTTDIRLFEIVYFEGAKQPSFYYVHGRSKEERGWLENYSIPHDALLQYFSDIHITPLVSTIKYTDIEEVVVNEKRIKIRYYPRWALFRWGKTRKISFTDIASIELVSTHPISDTEDHYEVRTRQGDVYKFSTKEVKVEVLQQYAASNGIEIVKKYVERRGREGVIST